jgi:putative transposase
MGRPYRTALRGYVYHMLNRGNGRLRIFHKDGDYEAFERILGEALEHVPGMRLLAYCLLPNHWHLVVWPRRTKGRTKGDIGQKRVLYLRSASPNSGTGCDAFFFGGRPRGRRLASRSIFRAVLRVHNASP